MSLGAHCRSSWEDESDVQDKGTVQVVWDVTNMVSGWFQHQFRHLVDCFEEVQWFHFHQQWSTRDLEGGG